MSPALRLTGAVKGHCVHLGSAASVAADRDQFSFLVVVVVTLWLCLVEWVGLTAPKDTHLPSAQDDRAEWRLMITAHTGGRGTPGETD